MTRGAAASGDDSDAEVAADDEALALAPVIPIRSWLAPAVAAELRQRRLAESRRRHPSSAGAAREHRARDGADADR